MAKQYFLTSGSSENVQKEVNAFLAEHATYKCDVNFVFTGGMFAAEIGYEVAEFHDLNDFRKFIERPPFCREGCPHCKEDAYVGGTCALTGLHNPQFKRMCEIGIIAFVKNGGTIK